MAHGTPAPSYQWQLNSRDILGATSDSLSLQNVQLPDIGEYIVVVSNTAGVVRSEPALLTLVILDADADQIPDEWERLNQLNPNDSTDAGKDFDGDGSSNWQEYLSGTDPNNRSNFLAVSLTGFTTNEMKLTFEARAGRSYTVEYRASLEKNQRWSTLQHVPAESNLRIVSLSDTLTNNTSQRFYRIVSRRNQ